MFQKKVLLCLLFGLAASLGCQRKMESLGEGTALYVFADQEVWQTIETPVRNAFERTIQTPRDETVFLVQWVPPERFNEFATQKNLAFVGLLNQEGVMNHKVHNMLSTEVRERVEDGSVFVFPKEDPWAKRQLLLVFAGTSTEQLSVKLEENKDYLYGLLEKRLRAETEEKMFEQLEQKELSREILAKYGWTMRIQHDYFVNIDRADENFLMLRRSLPGKERWLFVSWIENGNPESMNEDWVINRRNFLTNKFYKGDQVYQSNENDYRTVSQVDFADRLALKVQGLWVNDEDLAKSTGGPFWNYTFYDEDTDRIYMIDIAVWFPGGDKEPFLRQLDIMAHSFRTVHDFDKEQEGS